MGVKFGYRSSENIELRQEKEKVYFLDSFVRTLLKNSGEKPR